MRYQIALGLSMLCLMQLVVVLNTNAADGDFDWASKFGGSGVDRARAVAVDDAGNVFITGSFEGTVDFDPGAGTAELTAGATDIFVCKLDGYGNYAWAHRFGGPLQTERGFGIDTDSGGNVYVTGRMANETVDFDPGAGTANVTPTGVDPFILKLDTDGNYLWAGAFVGSGNDQAFALTVDSSDNVHICGIFSGTTDFDIGAGTSNVMASGTDGFVTKLDSDGGLVWVAALYCSVNITPVDLALDSNGNVAVTGRFNGSCDFDPSASTFNLTSTSDDAFVLKLGSNGELDWAVQARDIASANDAGLGIEIDSVGSVYSIGHFFSENDFDPGAGSSSLTPQSNDFYVWKLDTDGIFVWAKRLGSLSSESGDYVNFEFAGIALDQFDNVYTTGHFSSGTNDFDPNAGTLTAPFVGANDIFAVKLNSAGDLDWGRFAGSTGIDKGLALDVYGDGDVYMAGYYSASTDFDPGADTATLTHSRSGDAFVLKLTGPDLVAPNASMVTPLTSGPTNATSIDFNVSSMRTCKILMMLSMSCSRTTARTTAA